MESRHDTENAERILYNMTPQQLVDVCIQAYNQEDLEDENECEVSCRDVGHNIYILAHQVWFCWELGGNVVYRPIPSSKNSYFQNEAKCKIFFVKMTFICMRKKNRFHINSFAFSLALKERLRAIWKWLV